MSKTLYEILGIPKDANEVMVKTAYHKLALKYHPDKAADPAEAAAMQEKFAEISTAYNTLKDREKRAAYDQTLDQKKQAREDAQAKGQTKPPGADSGVLKAAGGAAAREKERLLVGKRAFKVGLQALQAGDYDKAEAHFETAIKNHDKDPLYHFKLAQTLKFARKSFSRATEAAKRSIELDTYNNEFRVLLAELYEAVGSTSKAVETYKEILKWDATNERAIQALAILEPKKQSLLDRFLGRR